MSDIKHSETGTYTASQLLPEEAFDLTLEQILTLLVVKIADHPDDVLVDIVNTPNIKVLDFSCHEDDIGPLVGREGYIARALRTVAKAALGPLVKRYRFTMSVFQSNTSHKT